MAPEATYFQKYTVLMNDVDFDKKMKVSSALNYFQDIAHLHSDSIGVGVDRIYREHNVIWVLTRIYLDIERYPKWNEEVTVETWPHLPEKLTFGRDYIMRDAEGKELVRCISSWVILDADKRRIRPSDTIKADLEEYKKEFAADHSLGKIFIPNDVELVYKRFVGCSDIDMNGHLNNSKYIDFIMDCFSLEQLKSNTAKSLQVNYISEALPGDTIGLYKGKSEQYPGCIVICGRRESDGANIFSCVIKIR